MKILKREYKFTEEKLLIKIEKRGGFYVLSKVWFKKFR
jgi:hypothetical protein